jgi:hypothetical protein
LTFEISFEIIIIFFKAFEFELKNIDEDTIEILNNENLWIPHFSYETWLTNLCVLLIKSGFLDDEICVLCTEVFEKKVLLFL